MSDKYTLAGRRMLALLEEISPLPRLVNSPGLDQTFEIVKRELPATEIHEYPAGREYGDWIVPQSWQVCEGVMKNAAGKIIASIEESLLFVAPYSEPVDGWFTKEEIASHLRTRPDLPDAFALEHRHAYDYQLVDWGVTLPHRRWEELPDEKYHIRIVTETTASPLKVAELFLPGKRSETICIAAHIDELCNDDLSGCVVAMELMHYLESLPERHYSYQMLLVPEMFGTLFYIAENPEKVANTIGMLNLETLGAGDDWCLKKTYPEGSQLEAILRMSLEEEGLRFKEVDFFTGYGNDERYFAWPTVQIPGVALQRFPFDRYHSSEDTPAGINLKYLLESLRVSEKFIQILEQDYIPVYSNRLPPWLTRRGLYFDSIDNASDFHKFNNLVLFNVNGKNSILDLAKMAGLSFDEVWNYLDTFVEQGIVNLMPVQW